MERFALREMSLSAFWELCSCLVLHNSRCGKSLFGYHHMATRDLLAFFRNIFQSFEEYSRFLNTAIVDNKQKHSQPVLNMAIIFGSNLCYTYSGY